MAVSLIDEDNFSYSRIQYRLLWYSEMASAIDLDLRVDIHIGLELETSVGELQPHLCRSRLFIDRWIDIRDFSAKRGAGIVRESHLGHLPRPDKWKFALIDINVYPYSGQVRDG